jgi:hypothetical protein
MPSAFPGIDPYLEEPSQWVLFACLHDRFHDLVYHLGLRRKHPPGRIVCSLSSPQLPAKLLDQVLHPPSLPTSRQRIEQRLGVLQVRGV